MDMYIYVNTYVYLSLYIYNIYTYVCTIHIYRKNPTEQGSCPSPTQGFYFLFSPTCNPANLMENMTNKSPFQLIQDLLFNKSCFFDFCFRHLWLVYAFSKRQTANYFLKQIDKLTQTRAFIVGTARGVFILPVL